MKLLIITQRLDRRDPIMGFFHRWILEYAKYCSQITVIGQYVGEYDLPNNVTVLSLGKEGGHGLVRQIFTFWRHLWNSQCDYTSVFAHMIPHWVLLALPFRILTKSRWYLWYEHSHPGIILRLTIPFVTKTFSASTKGMPIHSKKKTVTGHGIDTQFFCPGNNERDPYLIVSVGRISERKRLHIILESVRMLSSEYHLELIGPVITQEDVNEKQRLEEYICEHQMQNRVTFRSLEQQDLVPVLQKASFFLHAARTGLDKAVLEAMSCACLSVSCSPLFRDILQEKCAPAEKEFIEAVRLFSQLSQKERQELAATQRGIIIRDHSLSSLIQKLCGLMFPEA